MDSLVDSEVQKENQKNIRYDSEKLRMSILKVWKKLWVRCVAKSPYEAQAQQWN